MGTLCSITSGKSNAQDADENGAYVFFDRSKNTKRSNRYLYDCEALIIPGEGAEFLPRYFKGKFDLHQRAYALFDFNLNLNVWFLYYHLVRVKDYFLSVAVGTTVKSLRRRHFEQLQVPLPPLDEQQRIVRILDQTFDAIASAKADAERNLANAKALFERYVETAFRPGSDGWEYVRFGDLATLRNGINFTKSGRGETVRIIGVKDFQSNYWAPVESLESVVTDRTLPDLDLLRENDILFVRSNGNVNLIGRCLLVGHIEGRITHSGFTIRARLGLGIQPRYACLYLKSQTARNKMIGGGIGTNIKSLNQGTLSALSIPLPDSKKQSDIVDQIEQVGHGVTKLEALYTRKLAALDELKESLLHHAFAGEL